MGNHIECRKKDNSRFVAGDVNGDGEIDLVRYYRYKEKDFIQVFIQENNKFVSKFSQKLTDITTLDNSDSSYQLYNVLDVNNDGRDEIVIIHTVPFNSSITSWEFFIYSYQNSQLSLKTNNLPIANLNNEKEVNIIVANINNDNIPDWIRVRKDGYFRYATNYFQNSSVIKLQDVISEDLDIDKSFAIDYNGDGISELLIQNKGKWYLSPFLNKSSKAIQLLDDSNQPSANKYENVYIADLNNNGLQDIIFIANNLLLKTYYNKGDGTFDIIDSNAIYQKLIDNNEWANFATQKYLKLTTLDLHASDYNNDLINEISIYAQFDDKGKKMSAFVKLKDINHIGYSVTHFNVISGESYNLLSADFNNDGKEEIIKINNNGGDVQIQSSNTYQRNLLSTISANGIKRAAFQYNFASNQPLHQCPNNETINSDAKYLNISYPLVQIFSEPDGQGNMVSTTYKYYNGQYHTYLGILGFDKIEQSKTVEGNVLKSIMERELDKASFMPNYQKTTSYINGIKTNTQLTTYSTSIGADKIIKVLTDREVSSNELDGLATVKTYTYDEKGRIIKEKEATNDDLSQEITYESYTRYNNPTVITKAKKHSDDSDLFIEQTVKEYDDQSNLISSTEFANTDTPVTTSYTYYPNGRIKAKTTSGTGVEEIKESYEYSLIGGLKKITVREALTTTESYYNHFTGNLEKETIQLTNGPEAQTTYYGYDDLGRKTSIKYPDGKEWKQTLNWNTKGKGYYAIKEEATGETPVTKYFDILGREIYSTSKQEDVYVENATIYDACGRKISEVSMHPQKAGWTDYYSRDGRMEKAVTHTGNTELYAYNGRTITTKRNGKTYIKTLDSWENVLEQTDPSGITVRHTYSSNGQLVTTDAGGHTITMTYDDKGNKLSLNDPDVGETTYRYDGYGRLTRYKDPKGEYTLTYDEYGRMLQKKFTGGREVNYTYVTSGNGVGLVRSVKVKDDSREVFEYDKYGQVIQKTVTIDQQEYVYSNIYDNWGRLTRHIAPNGYMLNYAYDNTDSHLTGVTDGNNKTLWTYIKNIPGRESACLLSNQLKSEALSSENEEESILKLTRPNSTSLLEMNYSLDPILGNVTGRTEKYAGRSFTENFEYDEMDRLIRISGSSSMEMAYEPDGNIAFKQDMGYYRYNDGRRTHALTDIEEPTEQLKKLSTQTVTYTEFNKVESVQEGAYKMVFWYGADEQRIKSELYRNTLRIRTIHYGDGFERHIDANGNSKEYTYLDSDGGYFGMVVTENGASSTYYFIRICWVRWLPSAMIMVSS